MQDLVNLYLLANKLMDPVTANLVINQLVLFVSAHRISVSDHIATLVYSSTSPGNPLRNLVRDWFIHEAGRQKRDAQRLKALPRELLEDIIIETDSLTTDEDTLRSRHYLYVHTLKTVDRPKGHYHQEVKQKYGLC